MSSIIPFRLFFREAELAGLPFSLSVRISSVNLTTLFMKLMIDITAVIRTVGMLDHPAVSKQKSNRKGRLLF